MCSLSLSLSLSLSPSPNDPEGTLWASDAKRISLNLLLLFITSPLMPLLFKGNIRLDKSSLEDDSNPGRSVTLTMLKDGNDDEEEDEDCILSLNDHAETRDSSE